MTIDHTTQRKSACTLPSVRIGTDLVAVARIEKSIQRESFLKKVFHPHEIEQCRSKAHPAASFAARFAAKEAFFKALGTGLYTEGMGPQDVWIENENSGRPKLCLSPEAAALLQNLGSSISTDVSLAHDAQMAIATVIFQISP
ncbi:MAG: holo-[acyl-carrier-protein] synthase [Pseudomonadota bacterium]|jgi:holo-[acyl-carrier protein] synthase